MGLLKRKTKEEIVDVDADCFPSEPIMMARESGPYGMRSLPPGQRILWKVEDGVTWYLRNIDNRALSFEIISPADVRMVEEGA